MITEAERYDRAHLSWYDVARCPVHKLAVGMLNGKLAGQCDGCATEAANGLRRLKKMRSKPFVVATEAVACVKTSPSPTPTKLLGDGPETKESR